MNKAKAISCGWEAIICARVCKLAMASGKKHKVSICDSRSCFGVIVFPLPFFGWKDRLHFSSGGDGLKNGVVCSSLAILGLTTSITALRKRPRANTSWHTTPQDMQRRTLRSVWVQKSQVKSSDKVYLRSVVGLFDCLYFCLVFACLPEISWQWTCSEIYYTQINTRNCKLA